MLRGKGLTKTAPSPDPTSGERKRLSYDVFRLTLRDGVFAPNGSIVPVKKDLALFVLSTPAEGCRWWLGVLRLLDGRDADAEADQPATAATAVAAAPEVVGVEENIEPEERRGVPGATRLSHDTRRALNSAEDSKRKGENKCIFHEV